MISYSINCIFIEEHANRIFDLVIYKKVIIKNFYICPISLATTVR